MLDLNEAITGRSSLREYTAQIVDEPIVYSLTSAAIQAPNAVNQQPWTFSLLRDEHILDHVSREAKLPMSSNIPASSHAGSLLSMVNDRDFHTLYHATTLIVMPAAAEGPWIVEDCSLAAQNPMLAAYAAGLGDCWIGFA